MTQAATAIAQPPQDRRVWWFKVITDLYRYGYTNKSIAASLGVGATTVNDWKMGSRPKFDEGDKLIELWCQITGNSRETVPRISRYSHLA